MPTKNKQNIYTIISSIIILITIYIFSVLYTENARKCDKLSPTISEFADAYFYYLTTFRFMIMIAAGVIALLLTFPFFEKYIKNIKLLLFIHSLINIGTAVLNVFLVAFIYEVQDKCEMPTALHVYGYMWMPLSVLSILSSMYLSQKSMRAMYSLF